MPARAVFCKKRSGLRAWAVGGLAAALAVLVSSCAGWAKKSADDEVYQIIEDKRIEGMPTSFTIERDENAGLQWDGTTQTLVLTLPMAIEIAVENSREFQTRREALYEQGLNLTMARHEWDPIFSGTGEGEVAHLLEREPKIDPLTGETRIDPETGQARTMPVYKERFTGAFRLGVRRMLVTGGDISIAMVSQLTRYIHASDPDKRAGSAFEATLTQPLLKGFGMTAALEGIRQAERDMAYAIRSFVRYRRRFSIDIAKDYYNLIERRDRMENDQADYENQRAARERAEMMAAASRTPMYEVDQRRQREFRARDNWQSSVQDYNQGLDQFKLTLGIPLEIPIEIAPDAKEELQVTGLDPVPWTLEEATSIALAQRLDLRTTIDAVEDAERKVKVAENGLLMRADANLFWRNSSNDPDRPWQYEKESQVYGYGGEVELPLDKKADRNVYRMALIDWAAAKRLLRERIDQIKLEIRDAFRNLQQAESSYQIQMRSLQLARRRVESTTLLQLAGRVSTRDVLEAQQDFLDAQNAVTRALIDHATARLDLVLAMEALRIDDRGLYQRTVTTSTVALEAQPPQDSL